MGEKMMTSAIFGTFLPFLDPLLRPLSCRGGSKLQFGGSYVKIG